MATYGIVLDTSNNNPITEAELKASKAVALIAKATEGTSYQDPTYHGQRAAAAAAGVPFGSYLFLHPSSQGSEAAYFLKFAKPAAGEPVFIDCEVTDGSTMSQVAARAKSCAIALTAAGLKPILYSSTSFLKQLYVFSPALKYYRCWEADYPHPIYAWSPTLVGLRARLMNGVSVCMWQFTDTFKVGTKQFDASILLAPLNTVFASV